MRRWQLQEAKARLSEVVKATEKEGPQEITVRGNIAAVLLSRADYERLTRKRESFVEFMRKSPLAGLKLEIVRDRSVTRDVVL